MIRVAFLFFILFLGLWVARTQAESKDTSQQPVRIDLKKPSMDGEIPLSIVRAVELALERNPDLIVEKIRLENLRAQTEEEKGTYDPVFSLRASTGRKDNVVASRFFPRGFYIEQERTQGLNLGGKTYTGGRYGIDFSFQRQK